MKRMFEQTDMGAMKLANRFVFPPIKTAYGVPDGSVTERHLTYYRQIAQNGPGLIILEPVPVTLDGKEHPKQLCIHLDESADALKKIVDVIHAEGRLACLHLNHGGAAANPKASGTPPKAPSPVTCMKSGLEAQALTQDEIDQIIEGYKTAAAKAVKAGFDAIEIQGGHGYLVSQFLNAKINRREDAYGQDRTRFAQEVLRAVKAECGALPCILRISGNEMSPEFGVSQNDLAPLLKIAEKAGISAVHVGMGSACFSPPWYFHHASLPAKPQNDALAWVREQTNLPVIAAGRMGRPERITQMLDNNMADFIALGRPLISDPDLIAKWQTETYDEIRYCGYCLQGCLHRVKTGEPLGCNLNPEIGQPPLEKSAKSLQVLVAGGGPAGLSAAFYLSKRGHAVTLVEKENHLGGQFDLAWQAPGKANMRDGLDSLIFSVKANTSKVTFGRAVDANLVTEMRPDLLVWACGAVQNIPTIPGLENQNTMTSIEYFQGAKEVQGPRVLVIGAGRTGLEIAEKLGSEGFEVTATKRTDPIGSMMEMITKKLTLMRISQTPKVTLMPLTTVKAFHADHVRVEKEGAAIELEPFQTVILASGMSSVHGPDKKLSEAAAAVEIIGDAAQVSDIYSAMQAGYALARKY